MKGLEEMANKTQTTTREGFRFVWTNHPKDKEVSVEAIHIESGISVMDWGYPYMSGVRGFYANVTLWGDQALIEANYQHRKGQENGEEEEISSDS